MYEPCKGLIRQARLANYDPSSDDEAAPEQEALKKLADIETTKKQQMELIGREDEKMDESGPSGWPSADVKGLEDSNDEDEEDIIVISGTRKSIPWDAKADNVGALNALHNGITEKVSHVCRERLVPDKTDFRDYYNEAAQPKPSYYWYPRTDSGYGLRKVPKNLVKQLDPYKNGTAKKLGFDKPPPIQNNADCPDGLVPITASFIIESKGVVDLVEYEEKYKEQITLRTADSRVPTPDEVADAISAIKLEAKPKREFFEVWVENMGLVKQSDNKPFEEYVEAFTTQPIPFNNDDPCNTNHIPYLDEFFSYDETGKRTRNEHVWHKYRQYNCDGTAETCRVITQVKTSYNTKKPKFAKKMAGHSRMDIK